MSDAVKALNQQRWGAAADGYVHSAAHADSDSLQRLIDMAQPQPSWRMLDVAAGGGHTALAFAPHVDLVVAYDLTSEMLRAARSSAGERPNVRWVQGDAEALPFHAAFDLVTCRLAAHHFPDVPRFLREAARVLRAGGLLLVQDHLAPTRAKDRSYVDTFEKLRDPSHLRALNLYEWRRHCRDAGLHILEEQVHETRHTLLPWAQRQRCTPETILWLQIMLAQAPSAVRAYLQPQDVGTPFASFVTPNLYLCARKLDSAG
jgi:ubiquinone/menaquinone biosynthesis C-methylase UbiE